MASIVRILTLVWILLCSSSFTGTVPTDTYKKVCQGTSNGGGFTHAAAHHDRYESLKKHYKGCVYVDGNLELVYYEGEHTFYFLNTIEEVSGYVLIVTTYAHKIQLKNLRIIRGQRLYSQHIYGDGDHTQNGFDHSHGVMDSNRTRNYSLYVSNTSPPDDDDEAGLTYLVMPKLTEISAGNVGFESNRRLCFVDTINWKDILSGEGAKAYIEDASNKTHCGRCPDTCKDSTDNVARCWTKIHCQNLTRIVCAPQCSGRCFGRDANQCCHQECAAGCHGPLNSDCYSCKHFNDEGRCVPICPPRTYYDIVEKIYKQHKHPKYTYGSQCVKECPVHLNVLHGGCVADCGDGKHPDKDRNCIECGANCPRSCLGTGDEDFVHASNIKRFVNCSIVKGCIKIQQTTFTGDDLRSIPPMTVADLTALENVTEITDYLRVDSDNPMLRNLSFLRNLEVIHGRNLDKWTSSLRIHRTNMTSLGLNRLREVRFGKIIIDNNRQLCFADTWNWSRMISDAEHQEIEIKKNANSSLCGNCSSECTSDGCMGAGDDQCFECSNYKYGSRCIRSCADHRDPYLTLVTNSTECRPCHEQCLDSCTGESDTQCHRCRHYRSGGRCVPKCPDNKYNDTNGNCQPCNPNCIGGCSGPSSAKGPNGCNECSHVIHWRESGIKEFKECISRDAICPSGYYKHDIHALDKTECYKCDDQCIDCSGDGPKRCNACRHFVEENICVATCSENYYDDDKICRKCHDECVTCKGPSASDCDSCRLYIVYDDFGKRTENPKFNCTDSCPKFAANKHRLGNSTYCVADKYVPQDGKLVAVIAGTICGGVFFIGLLAVIGLFLRRQVARAEEKKLRLTAKISGIVECEPLTPSSAKPDMAVLRLIKESDLRRSGIIGSGAFGTVYKGLWIPEGENVKIPVAIKVLQEGAGENANILEEARIMASVVHPCCLHVLAVCLTAQVMLITQLMPLGCLLDYVRKHRESIGSKVILNWCTQIARGMGYLEERGIIHRDLAARNVLVHSPNHVKITDFGLAKLVNEDGQFFSTGGKLPIKWLALESIRNRLFTHKSDVWSFGVTVWELCTYGQRPYENANAADIVNLLEKGERLPQPSICTIDVYMIMIKCWMLGAESRPSFAELAEEFAKMARDPGRYLVIPNDKLMRLPSQPADFRELLRNVSLTLDGPEEVVMADEYVNDHTRNSRFRRNDKLHRDEHQSPIDEEDSNKQSPQNNIEPVHNSDSRSPGSRSRLVPRLELTTPQNRHSGTTWVDETGRDSPRYSPDPCSVSYHSAFPPSTAEDGTVGTTLCPGDNKKKSNAVEFMRVPLDGSDYLQLRSSCMVPTSYLELVDYTGTDGMAPEDENEIQETPIQKGSGPDERTSLLPQSAAIDNPEYFQPTNSTPLLAGQVR